jgi:RNA polymerase sigma factor (sigma-70 family)
MHMAAGSDLAGLDGRWDNPILRSGVQALVAAPAPWPRPRREERLRLLPPEPPREPQGPSPSALERDRQLLRRWRDGDRDAGTELLGHYRGLFYRTCLRFGLRDEERMLEVYHDVVVGMLEILGELPEQVHKSFAGFFAWRVRSAIRSQRARKTDQPLPEQDPGTGDRVAGVLAWDAIENCWDKLPPREHKVFELRYLHELSLKETAAVLGSNVNAVGQSIFRLVRKMRDCLSRSGYGGEFAGTSEEVP